LDPTFPIGGGIIGVTNILEDKAQPNQRGGRPLFTFTGDPLGHLGGGSPGSLKPKVVTRGHGMILHFPFLHWLDKVPKIGKNGAFSTTLGASFTQGFPFFKKKRGKGVNGGVENFYFPPHLIFPKRGNLPLWEHPGFRAPWSTLWERPFKYGGRRVPEFSRSGSHTPFFIQKGPVCLAPCGKPRGDF